MPTVFIEKYPDVREPIECKPMLLKGQLYVKTLIINVEQKSRKDAPQTDILLISKEGSWVRRGPGRLLL